VNSRESLRATDARPNAVLQEATSSALPWIALTRVGIEVMVFASMVVLARLIPPSAFGVFALAVIVQELAVGLLTECVGSALVQRKEVTREHFQAGLLLGLLVGTAFAAMTLVVAATIVRSIFGDDVAALIALTTPWYLLAAVLALSTAALRRRLDFRRLAILDLVNTIVRAGTCVLLAAVVGLDAMALVLGALAGICATVVVACVLAPVPLPRWHSRAAHDLFQYGAPTIVSTLAMVGFRNGDYAIVGARLGTATAGLYWRGYQLGVEYQRKISVVMSQVGFPMLSRTLSVRDMFALRERMARLATVAVFPLLATLIMLAPVIVPWLFGATWEDSVLPTQILAVGGAAMLITDITGSTLQALGRTRAIAYWATAHFVVDLGAVFLASRHGLIAVCIAAVASHVALAVVGYWVLLQGRAKRALWLFWADIRPAAVSCVALVAVAWPVSLLLGDDGIPAIVRVVLAGCAGLIAYVGSLKLWFPAALRDLSTVVRRVLPTAWLWVRVRRVLLLADG
jgi:O-antigen/teichoic acid export membrane protein